MEETVLLVEDDDALRGSLAELLKDRGYRVVTSRTAQEGIRLLSDSVSAVVTDLKLPDASGMEVLRAARREDPELPVVVVTGYGSTPSIVEAMREGAFHYIDKPVDPEALFSILTDALKHRARAREIVTLRQALDEKYGFENLIGNSEPMHRVFEKIRQVAPVRTSVLIEGASGTGKELVAGAIHHLSPRRSGPFVALNCAALPEQLLESELFGVERGAFTGAVSSRAGKIEQGNGGVLFLDEVGEMTPSVQAKFLRVLQEREFQRLGGAKTIKVDVRVIAATNRNPREAMTRGSLREDLYYRLSVFELTLPPLRERPDDILMLAEAFLAECASTMGRPAAGLSEDARDLLMHYSWPGNVRELRNAIERAVILCEGGLVTRQHLPITVVAAAPTTSPGSSISEAAHGPTLGTVERQLLEKALANARNNKSQAAKLLGIRRGKFYSLLRRHGLTDARR